MSIGAKIKQIRKEKGLSQEQLGELCEPKMKGSAIRRIENTDTKPRVDTVNRIASALNVSPYKLMLDSFDDLKSASEIDKAFIKKRLEKNYIECEWATNEQCWNTQGEEYGFIKSKEKERTISEKEYRDILSLLDEALVDEISNLLAEGNNGK